MSPTSELMVSADTIILGFAIARLLHGASGIFSKNKSSLTIIFVWISCCIHIAITLWTNTNRFELRLDFLDFVLQLIYASICYFMCDSLTPHNAEKIESFSHHFISIRKKYWSCHISMSLLAAVMFEKYQAYDLFIEKYEMVYLFIITPWLLISLFGFFAKSKQYQFIAALLFLILIIFNSSVTLFESASLTNKI